MAPSIIREEKARDLPAAKAGVLIPVEKPDREALDANLNTHNIEIKALQKKMNAAEAKIKALFETTKGTRSKRSDARDKMMLVRAEKKKVMDERKKIYDARDAFQKTLANMREAGKKLRSEHKYKSCEDIDKAIERLERRQATSSMTLTEEKKLLKEITMLKASRKSLEDFAKSNSGAEGTKTAVRGLNAKLNVVNAQLKDVNSRLDTHMAIVKELEGAIDAAHKDEVPALKEEKSKIKAQIDAKYNSIRKMRADYNNQNKQFRDYLTARNKMRDEQRKAEQAAYEKAKAEERRLKEEEEEKRKPWLQEISSCDLLITYLKSLKPKEKKVVISQEASTPVSADSITTNDGSVLMLVSKKGGDIEMGPKGKRGKKLRKKNKKPVTATLSHPLETFDDFKKLGLSAPLEIKDVDASIEALQAKRNYFDTKPRAMKKVKTPYGAGKVHQTRQDGSKIIEMDWKLAEGAKVMAYLQTKDIDYK
jgi:uncharacterized coiled-coil DUF342 family protein